MSNFTGLRNLTVLATVLTLLSLPTSVADAGLFDRIGLGGPTYQSFKGKFVDSDTVKAAHDPQAASTGTVKAVGEAIGALDFDGIPSPALKAYGNKILNRLLAGWGGPRPTMRLWITADPGLAAESTGNGDLYIARGWFDQVESEDEIAAIMAHEISHVLLNHFARAEGNEDRNRSIASAASVATTAFALGSVRVQGNGTDTTLTEDKKSLHNNVRKTLLLKFAIDEFSDYTLNAPWAREQEDQADLLGTDLLYRAKYNTLAMKKALERLKSYEESAAKQVDDLSSQYDAVLKAEVAQGNVSDLKATFSDILGNVALEKGEDLREKLTRSHPDTQDRIDDIAKYIAREYEDDPGPPPEKNELQRFLAGREVKAEFASHTLAVKTNAALTQGNVSLAKAMAAKSLAGSGAPYPLRIDALVLQQSGDAARGLEALRRASGSGDASFTTVIMLASTYANAKRYKEAHATLEDAARRFGSVEATYPATITVDLAEGKKDDAAAVYKTCGEVKNSDLVSQCRIANGDSCTGSAVMCAFKDRGQGVTDALGGLLKQQ